MNFWCHIKLEFDPGTMLVITAVINPGILIFKMLIIKDIDHVHLSLSCVLFGVIL